MNKIGKRLQRLQQLRKERPQYTEIFDFYEKLYRFLEQEQPDWLRAEPDQAGGELKRQEGFPLLEGRSLHVHRSGAAAFLNRLTSFLEAHGKQGQEALAALRRALQKQGTEVTGLFAACLGRDRRPVAEAAAAMDVPAPLLEYVLDTALSFALHRLREEGLTADGEGWPHGWCPLCGGLPAMGEFVGEEGRQRLHCATCGSSWQASRLRCVTCGNQEGESLEYFTAEGEEGYRVNVCRKCSSYLKVVDSRRVGADLPMDLEDVATLHLDLLAQREGFTRGKRNGGA